MNVLFILVLLALAWYSFEAGMEFFALLMLLGVVLLVFVDRKGGQEQVYYGGVHGAGGHQVAPFVVEEQHEKPQGRGSQLYQTQHIRLQIKPKWPKMWSGKPNEYFFYHGAKALDMIARSILYVLGIEKDKAKE